MASGKRESLNIIAIVGPFGHKIVKQRKEKCFGLGKWAGCGKRRSVFQKMGDFIFSTTAFLGTGENWHLIEKGVFCQFFKTYLRIETLGRSFV